MATAHKLCPACVISLLKNSPSNVPQTTNFLLLHVQQVYLRVITLCSGTLYTILVVCPTSPYTQIWKLPAERLKSMAQYHASTQLLPLHSRMTM
jgi:hypothetical protein